MREGVDGRVKPATGTREDEAESGLGVPVKTDPQRPQQRRQVLARLKRADEKQERVGLKAVPVDGARCVGRQHERREVRGGSLVDDGNAFGRQIQLGGDVLTGGLRDGDDSLGVVGGGAHLPVEAACGGIKQRGEVQEGQVVDGDDGGTGAAARGDKIGAVQPIQPLAPHLDGQAPLFVAVVRRG